MPRRLITTDRLEEKLCFRKSIYEKSLVLVKHQLTLRNRGAGLHNIKFARDEEALKVVADGS